MFVSVCVCVCVRKTVQKNHFSLKKRNQKISFIENMIPCLENLENLIKNCKR